MVDSVDETPESEPSSTGAQHDIAAQPVIDAFGGIRPMAAKLGVPVSTVQGWKQRDTIPAGRVASIAEAARLQGVTMPETSKAEEADAEGAGARAAAPAGVGVGAGVGGGGGGDNGEHRSLGERPRERRSAGPRPPMRFTPPDDDAAPAGTAGAAAPGSATEGATPSSGTPSGPSRTRPSGVGSNAPAGSDTGGRRVNGAMALAAVALAVAVLWPIAFGAWLGADAQEGDTSALADRLTVLEQAAGGSGSEALEQAIVELRSQVDALTESEPSDPAADAVQALSDRIAALESAAGEAGTASAEVPPAITDALDSLQRSVSQLNGVVDQLQAKIATVEDDVSRIEAAADGAPVDELRTAIESVRSTLDQVQGDLQQVTAVAEAAQQQAVEQTTALVDREVGRLGERIAALAGADETAAGHQAFLIALGQLSARLRTADPFADELAALRQMASGSETLAPTLAPAVDDAFAPLAEAAAEGVPTLAGLRADFDDTRLAVLKAAGGPPEDTLDEIWGEISGMVTISRVDRAGTGTVDGILAAAESHLAAGDLAGAVAALEGLGALGSGYADAAAPWIADARLRLAADQAIDSVQQAALGSFRPGEPATEEPASAEPTSAEPASEEPAPAEDGRDDGAQ